MIGKIVTVTVDRPLGSRHPKHSDILYTLNYGFVPDVFAPDGEEQDVYVLGIDEPVTEFTGQVIAVIRRSDDSEDKLVIAPTGNRFTAEEILKKVWFVEQYFTVSVEVYTPAEDNV